MNSAALPFAISSILLALPPQVMTIKSTIILPVSSPSLLISGRIFPTTPDKLKVAFSWSESFCLLIKLPLSWKPERTISVLESYHAFSSTCAPLIVTREALLSSSAAAADVN
jgi:hypothetical protein